MNDPIPSWVEALRAAIQNPAWETTPSVRIPIDALRGVRVTHSRWGSRDLHLISIRANPIPLTEAAATEYAAAQQIAEHCRALAAQAPSYQGIPLLHGKIHVQEYWPTSHEVRELADGVIAVALLWLQAYYIENGPWRSSIDLDSALCAYLRPRTTDNRPGITDDDLRAALSVGPNDLPACRDEYGNLTTSEHTPILLALRASKRAMNQV